MFLLCDIQKIINILTISLFIVTGCGQNLGLASGQITKGQIKTSSEKEGMSRHFGRLNHEKAWCALETDKNPFFSVMAVLNFLKRY